MLLGELLRVSPSCVLAFSFCLVVSAQPSGQDKKELVLTEKANNTSVKIARGSKLAISLEGIPGAGFTWVVAKNDPKVLETTGKVEVKTLNPKLIGGKAMMTLRFEAKAVGICEVELHYRRPFEKDKKPARTFKVKVEVAE